ATATVFCGRHLLAAKLRPSNIDASAGAVEEVARIAARIRTRWPRVRILLRADSGFAREELMGWCERNGVDFLFGLAKNARLTTAISPELDAARRHSEQTAGPARRFKDFTWSTLAGQLEPVAPRHRQGRMDRRRGQPALHCHLAVPRRA